MRTLRPLCLTTLAAIVATSWIVAARAGTTPTTPAPTLAPTTQPLRTIAVVGTAEVKYQTNLDDARKKAVASSCDAALADAKQNAERATKVLGVHLGAPITVEAPSVAEQEVWSATGEKQPRFLSIESSVRIVFELVP